MNIHCRNCHNIRNCRRGCRCNSIVFLYSDKAAYHSLESATVNRKLFKREWRTGVYEIVAGSGGDTFSGASEIDCLWSVEVNVAEDDRRYFLCR